MKQMLNTLNISDFISKCTDYIYLIQNSQAVKKQCGPQKKVMVKKDVKSKVAAKKWL